MNDFYPVINEIQTLEEYINNMRFGKVVKSNILIVNTIHSLGALEQKLLSYIISKINKFDTEFRTITFELTDYLRVCNMNLDSGKNYRNIKQALVKLSNTKTWIKFENEEKLDETMFQWITAFNLKTDKKTNKTMVSISLNPFLQPYLLQLKGKFTYYELINILAMRSQYSLRLYEILKSYVFKGEVRYEIEDFKRVLNAEHYKKFAQIRIRVIEPALDEINKYTDIQCSYSTVKESRMIAAIVFYVNLKENAKVIETYQTVIGTLDESEE